MGTWVGSPPGACPADDAVHGALVGAIGPGGSRDVSGRAVAVDSPGMHPSLLAAHGAAVPAPTGAAGVPVAQGALVPDGGICPADGTAGSLGWDCVADVWTDVLSGTAFGSRFQLKREPKGKCCTTGNLDSTSALYILIIPWIVSNRSVRATERDEPY